MKAADGLSHHGDPAEEEEVIVVEEPERSEEEGPKVMRAPRVPTPKEVEAHEATHIPHEEWCETCMAGRGRNRLQKQRKFKGVAHAPRAGSTPCGELAGGSGDTPDASLEDDVPVKVPVPRVCMDHFYVSSRKVGHAMSTKELQKRLREMGKSDQGQRNALIRRHEKYADVEDQDEGLAGAGADFPTPGGRGVVSASAPRIGETHDGHG